MPPRAGGAPLRVAGPGAARRRGLRWCSSPPSSAVIFGGHDYLAAHHRADLRGVRPPGVRPAHGRHRCSPCSSSGPPPARRRARRPRTGSGSAGSLGLLCAADPGRRRAPRCTGCTSTRRPTASPGSACWSTSSRAGSACWCSRVLVGRAGRCGRPGCPASPCSPGSVALLVLAAVNPDAWIARAQPGPVRRRPGRSTGPTCATSPRTPCPCSTGRSGAEVAVRLPRYWSQDDDWLEWNLGRSRASDAVDDGPEAMTAALVGGAADVGRPHGGGLPRGAPDARLRHSPQMCGSNRSATRTNVTDYPRGRSVHPG